MTPRQAGQLLVVAAIWGSSYLLIKYALEGFSPGEVVFLRATAASLLLVPLCWLRGGETRAALRAHARQPRLVALVGLLFVALPFALISYGEKVVPVGLTAILIAPSPLFVAALAPLLDDRERLNAAQWAGLAVGMAGIVLLVGVESVGSWDEVLGALALVGAAASYAGATYVVRLRFAGVPSIVTSALAVSAGAVIVLPLAIVTAASGTPSTRAVVVTIVLGLVNTALAFVLFYALIGEIGAGKATLVSYLTPPFSIAFGIAFRDEALTLGVIAGCALILLGIAMASRKGRAPAAP